GGPVVVGIDRCHLCPTSVGGGAALRRGRRGRRRYAAEVGDGDRDGDGDRAGVTDRAVVRVPALLLRSRANTRKREISGGGASRVCDCRAPVVDADASRAICMNP
ncbi:hypothetical protein, partial [Streptomyces geysiriensis]|uniref:hypothetical protein n=1 Tax=Streptomyces geysiriensis TaxID=68207 RepID=UPI001C7D63B3